MKIKTTSVIAAAALSIGVGFAATSSATAAPVNAHDAQTGREAVVGRQATHISRLLGGSYALRQRGPVKPGATKQRPRLVRRCHKTYPGVAKSVHQSSTSRYFTVIVPGTVCRWEWSAVHHR